MNKLIEGYEGPVFVSPVVTKQDFKRVCVCVCVAERKKTLIDFKDLAHAVMGIGMSEVCRAGWQAGDLGKGWM